MTVPLGLDRDGSEVEALVTDRYLEALLSAGDRVPVPLEAAPTLPAAELQATISVLHRALVRVHPSFRFEERLGARLAALAAARSAPAVGAAGWRGSITPFPLPGSRPALPEDPLLEAILAGELDPAADDLDPTAGPDRRPLLVGGAALTSAALSIAGVAFLAWRASRAGAGSPPATAMTRATRTAHARRAALAGAGLPGGTA